MKKILIPAAASAVLLVPNATYASDSNGDPSLNKIDFLSDAQRADEYQGRHYFNSLSFLFGLGGSLLRAEAKTFSTERKIFSDHSCRFMATLGAAGSKTFYDNYYFGTDFLFDYSSNNKDRNGSSYMKMGGLFFSLGLKLGYITTYNTLFYGKVSAVHSRAEVYKAATNQKTNSHKFAPSFAIGIEQVISQKYSARLEGEYRMKTKKKDYDNDTHIRANDGFVIRALLSYNVHL